MMSTNIWYTIIFVHAVAAYTEFPEGDNYVMPRINKDDFKFGGETGMANWDSFLFYFYRFPPDPHQSCMSQGLEVNLRTPTGDYLPAVRLLVGCHINRNNLNNIIYKCDDNTLYFRLGMLKCYTTSFYYKKESNKESVGRKNRHEFYCDSWDPKSGPTTPDAKVMERQCTQGSITQSVQNYQSSTVTPVVPSTPEKTVTEERTQAAVDKPSPPPAKTVPVPNKGPNEDTTKAQADQKEKVNPERTRGRSRFTDELV